MRTILFSWKPVSFCKVKYFLEYSKQSHLRVLVSLKAVVGGPAGPDWFLAMVLNLHQVSNQLAFKSVPLVHLSTSRLIVRA